VIAVHGFSVAQLSAGTVKNAGDYRTQWRY
jgi:hypothetical protein